MSRAYPQFAVGIALSRAVLCPNDETVYDTEQWVVCPTCVNKEGISLSRILGGSAASVDRHGRGWGVPSLGSDTLASGLLAKVPAFLREEH